MLKSISFLWLGTVFGAAFSFLIQVLLARALEVGEFGIFSAVFGFVSLIAPLAGFGVASFWLKAFGEEGWGAIRWFKISFYFVFWSTVFVLFGLFLWGDFASHDDVTRKIFFVLSFVVLGQAFIELISSKYQLEENYLLLAVWQFLPHLLRFTLVFGAIFIFDQPSYLFLFSYCYVAVSLFMAFIGVRVLYKMSLGGFQLKGHGISPRSYDGTPPNMRTLFFEVWPFGVAGFVYLIYFQSNIVVLKYMVGDDAAGIYSVAFVVLSAVYLIPAVLYQKYLMPKIHRWANSDFAKLFDVYKRGNFWMLLLGGGAMIGVVTLSPYAIPLVFGEKYSYSIFILAILSVAIPVRFLATSIGAMLVTQGNMKKKVIYMTSVAVFSLVVNFIFIPLWGIKGAAFASVLSEVLLLSLYFYGVRKYVFCQRYSTRH